MNRFYDRKVVIAMKVLLEVVVAYAGDAAPGYIEEGSDGVKVMSVDECQYML